MKSSFWITGNLCLEGFGRASMRWKEDVEQGPRQSAETAKPPPSCDPSSLGYIARTNKQRTHEKKIGKRIFGEGEEDSFHHQFGQHLKQHKQPISQKEAVRGEAAGHQRNSQRRVHI